MACIGTRTTKAISQVACLTVITIIVFGTYNITSDRSYAQSSYGKVYIQVQSEGSIDFKAEATDVNIHRRFDQNVTLQRRLPQCIIIGQMKCGTTALMAYLGHHPDIVNARYEVGYFNINYEKGLEWYRNQMPLSSPGQLTVEKTPSYCMSNITASRILALNSSIKAILLVRDPIARSVSHWIHSCHNRLNTDREEDKRICETYEGSGILTEDGHVNEDIMFIRRSVYADIIHFWTPLFVLGSQLLIVNGDKLVSDPVTELEKIERFLGVRNYLTNKRVVFDEERGFYCRVSDRGDKICMGKSKGHQHPTISPEVRDKLRKYFKPMNKRFYNAVGVDFGWS